MRFEKRLEIKKTMSENAPKMHKNSKIFIAGHKGMVGSAIVRKLQNEGFTNLVYRTKHELDLRNQQATADFFAQEKPEFVIIAAAKVGGIMANNTYRAEFIYDNLMIQNNLIHQSYLHGVKKLLYFGSSCIYPKLCPQPIKEEYLLSGPLEFTNEPYALARIAGIKMAENYKRQYGCNFISLMSTNLYGSHDHYDVNKSHVLPSLMRRIHEAKVNQTPEVVIWGTGSPLREFMHVDDLAEAVLFFMDTYEDTLHLNVGTAKEVSIKQLAEMIVETVGYEGKLVFDTTKPDGTPRKLLDVSRANALGWSAKIELADGLKTTYEWFLNNYEEIVATY